MEPAPAAHVVIPSSASLSGSPPAPGADDSSADVTSPAREAGWLHSLRESWRSQRFLVVTFNWGPPLTVNGDADAQGPLFTFVLALLACSAGIMVGILAELKDTTSRWGTAPKVLYGVTAVLAILSLAVGIMAAARHAAIRAAENSGNYLRASSFCARLGAILSTVLLVVAICCKLGRWGCATGVPCAAVVAVAMAVVWVWGDERAAARAFPDFWRRIQDLCPRCLSRAPSTTTDLELPAGREGVIV